MSTKSVNPRISLWHYRADNVDFLGNTADYDVLVQAKHIGRDGDNPHLHALVNFKIDRTKYKAKQALASITEGDYSLSVPTTPQDFLDYVCWEFVKLPEDSDSKAEYDEALMAESLINKTSLVPDITKSEGLCRAKRKVKQHANTSSEVLELALARVLEQKRLWDEHEELVSSSASPPVGGWRPTMPRLTKEAVLRIYFDAMEELNVYVSQFIMDQHSMRLFIAAGFGSQIRKFHTERILNKFFS